MRTPESLPQRSTQVFSDLLYSSRDSRRRATISLGIAILAIPFALRKKSTALPILAAVGSATIAFVNQLEAQEKNNAAYSIKQKTQSEEFKSESSVSLEQTTGEFALQSSEEFIAELVSSVDNAKDRVWLEFMQFESGELTSQLVDALVRAKERSVDVRFHLDPYAKYLTRVGNRDVWRYSQILRNPEEPLSGLDERTLKQRNRFMTEYDFEKLQSAGILEFQKKSGRLKYVPFWGGGNHRKFAVVDDVGWLGTTELTDSDVSGMSNFMLRIESKELIGELSNVFSFPPVDDAIIKRLSVVNPKVIDWELLVDSGKPNESVIYKRALDMIESAESSIEYVTQYWPEGLLKQRLIARARDGVKVKITMQAHGDHRIWRYPFKLGFQNFMREIGNSGLNLEFPSHPTHAKGLIIDGKAALFGSNNLFEPSIKTGVKELSIYTENPQLVRQIEERIFNHTK